MSNISFASLAEIQAHRWVGCHSGDSAAFQAVERFVLNESNPLADRASAIRVMGRDGMGLDPVANLEHLSDEQLLAGFFEEM